MIVSDLAVTEMTSALSRRTREKRLSREEAGRLYREVSKLRATSHRAEITPPIHRRAERLTLSLGIPLRTLDALHLATALDLEAATLVTFDPRLRDAATQPRPKGYLLRVRAPESLRRDAGGLVAGA